jgi:phosphoglycolate phosphatase
MKQTVSPFSAHSFKVKAILIDLDGTLIHTAPEIARAANAMLTTLNLPHLPLEKIESFIGDGAAALIKRCLSHQHGLDVGDAHFNQAQTLFFKHYAEVLTDSQPYPQIKESLSAMKDAGFPLACVTNKSANFTERLLQKTGLFDYFNLVVAGDTLDKKKPDPDQIFYVCKAFNIDPWEALLIGDSNTDILAAKNAGCYVFTVPYGYNQGLAIDESMIDIMLQDLSETLTYINNQH